MPQEKASKAVRKMAMALGTMLGIRLANLTGANLWAECKAILQYRRKQPSVAHSQAKNQGARIVANDFRQKAAEYRSQDDYLFAIICEKSWVVGDSKLEKLVTFLTAQEEWKWSMGKDHIILAHHPNSLLDARTKLWPAMFILSDFGRYPPSIANAEKDVIAPYKHIVGSYGGFVRQELFYMLKNEKDVQFAFGNIKKDGIKQATQGMHTSKFCLNIAGDTPSSNCLFDAIASHCVPSHHQ
nr:probable arabinosyltransferase ARAD1 [Ipomoea trifida]